MAKEAKKYYKVDPWKVIEIGFDKEQGRVGESIFSLGNEYMGIRGQFDEYYGGDKLIGCYFNGVYEDKPLSYPEYFNGLAKRCCFMINACNWLYTDIYVDGTRLDLNKVAFEDFYREIDMKTGIVTRSFTALGVRFVFERFVCINDHHIGGQQITLTSDKKHKISIHSGIDFTPIHEEEGKNYWVEEKSGNDYIICRTMSSGQKIYSKFKTNMQGIPVNCDDRKIVTAYDFTLKDTVTFEKVVYNYAEKDGREIDLAAADKTLAVSYEKYKAAHIKHWAEIWEHSDVVIEGDDESQQGIRFCIFNMHQTYHGDDGRLNVGAKGLTGEKYSGWTFWDSETYCLPFYMFNNPQAAKNLLMYRYNTLPQAKERAIQQDTKGACFPMVTIDGTESCGVWQHGNLEIHVTAAIAYGVWHYVRNTGDTEFLKQYGIELLVETSRYFASRGNWSPKTGEFGLWGVMGPDEFHMMVHNNTYTNYMVKKNFYYTLEMAEKYGYADITDEEKVLWRKMADKMRINYDEATGLYEQHDGYFDLPEYDVKHMDPNKVPIYKYWAYDSIFRVNMLKQPDVVLMQFFYSKDFTLEQKKVNFDFYEKRCSHESSLSPAIHSIMAAEIGNMEMAEEYMAYGSRVDIDDYNRNAHQGLHVTSMAAAWMNIVYGFGGMRSDGDKLHFAPKIPKKWKSYEFKIIVKGSTIKVFVDEAKAIFTVLEGNDVDIDICGESYTVSNRETTVGI